MEAATGADAARTKTLPVILIAAVIQGWALYALHFAVVGQHWPAGESAWLLALYACAVFVPTTVQLLAEHTRNTATWKIVAAIAILFFYFGWHHGASVADAATRNLLASGTGFEIGFVLLVLWLLVLPFAQARLASGRWWRPQYETLFATAWRNKLMLAEAALFTGLFWLLLFLWQMLFHMLGIDYFRELFQEPIFIYPVTALTFGLAIHLIGSVERFTSIVLQQLLSVLKWLVLLAGLILALFTVALIFKLPALLSSGERAIGAAWLLWLVAVIVLLVNAAYRDGSMDAPYPRWIGFALRLVIPLTIVIAATAVYALYVRVDDYGLTVERVWAFIVAGVAVLYSVGYTLAAWDKDARRGRWMAGMAQVNIVTALLLIATIVLTLTPILSPYRLAANSQYAMALQPPKQPAGARSGQQTPFEYLRFDAGRYGERRLRELAKLQDHPRADEIRRTANRAIERQTRWEALTASSVRDVLATLVVYPTGRSVDARLHELLITDMQSLPSAENAETFAGLYVDLNGDDVQEFVFVAGPTAIAYELSADRWRQVGMLHASGTPGEANLQQELGNGNVSAQPPPWRDLYIGASRYRLNVER